jgi:hypothetical protein
MKLFSNKEVIGETSVPLFQRLIDTTQGIWIHMLKIPLPSWVGILLFILFVSLYVVLHRKIKLPTLIHLHALNIIFFLICFSLINSERHFNYYGGIYVSVVVVCAYFVYLSLNSNWKYIAYIILTIYMVVNIKASAYYLYGNGSNQIAYARTVAAGFEGKIIQQPIQIVAIPEYETDSHFRYFLELAGYTILAGDSSEKPKEMFVMCFSKDCLVLGNPHWQIAAFSVQKPTISEQWEVEGVRIYKLIHKKI